MFDQIKDAILGEIKIYLKIFESTDQFIDFYSSEISFGVELDNFQTVFICFFTFLILISIAFILIELIIKKNVSKKTFTIFWA